MTVNQTNLEQSVKTLEGVCNEKYIFLHYCPRAACESPTSATELLQAAKLWSRMHAVIQVCG